VHVDRKQLSTLAVDSKLRLKQEVFGCILTTGTYLRNQGVSRGPFLSPLLFHCRNQELNRVPEEKIHP